MFTANNAAHAIEVLARERDNGFLLTDVIMPNGVRGIELARETRHLHPQMKIILTSLYPLPALRQAHGYLDEYIFISKPYRLMDLANTLRKAGESKSLFRSGDALRRRCLESLHREAHYPSASA